MSLPPPSDPQELYQWCRDEQDAVARCIARALCCGSLDDPHLVAEWVRSYTRARHDTEMAFALSQLARSRT